MKLLDRVVLGIVGIAGVAFHVARSWKPAASSAGNSGDLPRLLGRSLSDLLPAVRPDLANPYP